MVKKKTMRWMVIAASVGALVIVVVIDYATGYEFMFHTFYSIPVSMAAWYIGRRWAVVMSVASGIAWWLADWGGGHVYSRPIYGVWNAFICFASFAAGGILLAQLRKKLDESRRKSRELKLAHEELKQARAHVQELTDNVQFMSAWTKQIRDEGRWISLEEFFARNSETAAARRISPEALQKLFNDVPKPAAGPPRA
jgi:K+-sensing histidine kinase KdpD